MDNTNLELFKQALNEAVSNQFDELATQCNEELVYSTKHNLTMRKIVYGKTAPTITMSPKTKRLIAILIAASLLLTSCSIIFRHEIREVFENFFVKISYENYDKSNDTIKEVYSLGYIPEGYVLESQEKTLVLIKYKFLHQNGNSLTFEQRPINNSDYYIDSESSYSKIKEVEQYEIYYRPENNYYCYVWGSNEYYMKLISTEHLSNEKLILILNGLELQ